MSESAQMPEPPSPQKHAQPSQELDAQAQADAQRPESQGFRGHETSGQHDGEPTSERNIWRVREYPLVAAGQDLVSGHDSAAEQDLAAGDDSAAEHGLIGESVAVKDLFAVAGQRIGAGNPTWLAQQQPQSAHAEVVERLLEAGAEVTGIAHTDEFAFSLAGTNAHYGPPTNGFAPDRLPGGSSSGSASAVAHGESSIGLGTDTGGSIRVPSAYQGLWGIRTTHGAVSRVGLQPLAPSFDTVGWMTRGPELLAAVADVLCPHTAGPLKVSHISMIPELFGLAEKQVSEATEQYVVRQARLAGIAVETKDDVDLDQVRGARAAFTTLQMREAWAENGEWIDRHWETLNPDVAQRFRQAQALTAADEAQAQAQREEISQQITRWLDGGIMVLPSAASVAPLLAETADSAAADELRQRTLTLTALGSLSGLPVVNIPLMTASGIPTGLSVMGPAGSDAQLIRWAAALDGGAD